MTTYPMPPAGHDDEDEQFRAEELAGLAPDGKAYEQYDTWFHNNYTAGTDHAGLGGTARLWAVEHDGGRDRWHVTGAAPGLTLQYLQITEGDRRAGWEFVEQTVLASGVNAGCWPQAMLDARLQDLGPSPLKVDTRSCVTRRA
ncbi:hypothetical protein GCM10010193_13990 [Kitasatospora atroaurantiaca]|uniref:Uncharacterized protein n=1 Tax=Kitasatospora atroaurantiaca TaxID=285545 RepID=A0A561F212_9ACTN|nr:hypothetical protein [Kitasatospora atroaurantiaca]TWE21906.1 hypothetical protein FB465_7155 [Kitasatospora atroaurantiaca]